MSCLTLLTFSPGCFLEYSWLNQLFVLCTASQIIGGHFAKFCGLFRIYEWFLSKCQIKWKTVSNFVTFLEKLNSKHHIIEHSTFKFKKIIYAHSEILKTREFSTFDRSLTQLLGLFVYVLLLHMKFWSTIFLSCVPYYAEIPFYFPHSYMSLIQRKFNLSFRMRTHFLGFNKFELHSSAGPDNGSLIGRIIQKCQQKLPKL